MAYVEITVGVLGARLAIHLGPEGEEYEQHESALHSDIERTEDDALKHELRIPIGFQPDDSTKTRRPTTPWGEPPMDQTQRTTGISRIIPPAR